jgi:hypothetical protein
MSNAIVVERVFLSEFRMLVISISESGLLILFETQKHSRVSPGEHGNEKLKFDEIAADKLSVGKTDMGRQRRNRAQWTTKSILMMIHINSWIMRKKPLDFPDSDDKRQIDSSSFDIAETATELFLKQPFSVNRNGEMANFTFAATIARTR